MIDAKKTDHKKLCTALKDCPDGTISFGNKPKSSHRKVIKSTALKETETDSEDCQDTNMLKHVNGTKGTLHVHLFLHTCVKTIE